MDVRMSPDEPRPGRLLDEVAHGNPAGVDPADLVELLERSDARDRRAGAEALARLSSTAPSRVEPHVSTLDARLADDDPSVRAHLLCALASVAQDAPAAVETTDRVLAGLADDDARVREWAALAVAYVGVPAREGRRRAVDRLTGLREDDRASVRRNACLALGRLEAPEAVEPLVDDPDESVREVARQVHATADR